MRLSYYITEHSLSSKQPSRLRCVYRWSVLRTFRWMQVSSTLCDLFWKQRYDGAQ
uniref:Uncharacterized protein n=1 Tax=Utricularia reniformis TaxID=192314 RepID=A0A1Y0AYR4_9LAMI|nr:hypothetical protein AEK19_MT0595 [Utricularia reniformis]ART30295.1 hypothetical protein AEK19_MT0595 [Utricularia reniformis]